MKENPLGLKPDGFIISCNPILPLRKEDPGTQEDICTGVKDTFKSKEREIVMETRCEGCSALFSPGQLNCTYCGYSKQNKDDSKKIATLEDRVNYLDAQLYMAREEREKILLTMERREKILKTIRIAVGSLDTLGDSVAPSMESKVGRPIVRVNLKRMAELKTSDALFAKILFEEYRHVVAAVLLDIQKNWAHTSINPTNPAWVEYKQEILGESKESI